MDPDTTGRSVDPELLEDLAAQLGRLVDRLRSSSDVRLGGRLPSGGTRADAAHGLAQELADATAGLVGDPVRAVPRLGDLAVGDQVAVTGADLLSALDAASSGQGELVALRALASVRAVREVV